jgi:hypothetical protein
MTIKVKTGPCPGCCGRKTGALNCQSMAAQACLCGWPEFVPSSPARFYLKRTKSGSLLRHDFANPSCAGGTILPVGMSCRTRGGTASLCGFDEYIASSPPKKYRTLTLSGQILGRGYFDGACANLNCYATDTFTGSCFYNQATCVLTQNGTRTRTGTCPTGTYSQCNIGSPYYGDTEVLTPTTRTFVSDLACHVIPGGSFLRPSQPTAFETLSDEDTETDAIARLLAGAGGTWSGWTVTGDGSGGTCLPASCCLSRYQQRIVGFSFIYQEAQFQINQTGLLANTVYNVSIDLWRRSYGVGSFAFWKTIIVNGTTDNIGTLLIDQQDVPIDVGFETYAATAYITESFLTETADTWAYVGEYTLPNCVLLESDTSIRLINGVPSGKPDESDYAGFSTETDQPKQRDIVGTNTCVQIGPALSGKLAGTMTDALSKEDTIPAAIARALALASWSGAGCVSSIQNRNPGERCFGVKKSRVQGIFSGLTVGANYLGYIVFQGRVVGSADPWGAYGQQVISFTAVNPTETTPWVDVPLVSGMEIQAAYCYAAPA